MRILIIEDEEAAINRLRKALKNIEPDVKVVNALDSIESSVKWLREHDEPDLILMDVHLADGLSFEIFNLVNITCPVVFTTAYDEYALEAFRVNAVDYLLKPVKKSELERAILKYKQMTEVSMDRFYQLAREFGIQESAPKRLLIRIGQTIKVVDLKDAAYFYTESKISFVCTKEGKRYPVDYSLEKLESFLDANLFFRVNRQYIINIQAIDKMISYSKSRVKITLDPPANSDVIVSTERSSNFKQWLQGSLDDDD